MIEHLFSRMITTIASVALVAIVVSSSLGAVQYVGRDCAESVASSIIRLIEAASEMQVQSFEQRILIGEDEAHHDLTVFIDRHHVIVGNDGFECCKGLSTPVILMSAGRTAESLVATSGSILKISVTDNLFNRFNEVTIEVLG